MIYSQIGGYDEANELWIDFKLYFYVMIYSVEKLKQTNKSVVNWFQIVFLRNDLQPGLMSIKSMFGCELISNCIFT